MVKGVCMVKGGLCVVKKSSMHGKGGGLCGGGHAWQGDAWRGA